MGNKPLISLCMITCNQEKSLIRSLTSAQEIAEELIVVDTGSSDNTKEAAQQLGAQVFDFPETNNLEEAIDFSLKQAHGDWILLLNPEEELVVHNLSRLRARLRNPVTGGYLFKFTGYLEDATQFEPISDLVFRLFLNSVNAENPSDLLAARLELLDDLEVVSYSSSPFICSGNYKQLRSLPVLEKIQAFQPHNRINLFQLACEYYRRGSFQYALEKFIFLMDGLDGKEVYGAQLMRHIVECLYQLNFKQEALEYSRKGIQRFPDYIDLYYYQGIIYFAQQKYNQAYEAFQRCLSLKSVPLHYGSHAGVNSYKSLFYLGQLNEIFLDYEKALANYIEAVRAKSDFNEPLTRIVKILNPQKYPEYTIECLNKIFDFSAPESQYRLAQCLFKEGAYQVALEFLNEIVKVSAPHPAASFIRARCLMFTKGYFPALKEFKQITPSDSIYGSTQVQIFFCHWLQGNLIQASKALERARAAGIAPQLAHVLERLIRAEEGDHPCTENSHQMAMEVVELLMELQEWGKIAEVLPKLFPTMVGQQHLELGQMYYQHGMTDKAVEELQLALTQSPNDGRIFYLLGLANQRKKKFLEASNLLHQAQNLGFKKPRVFLEQAVTYLNVCLEALCQGVEEFPHSQALKTVYNKTKDALMNLEDQL